MRHTPFWITLGILFVTACSATSDARTTGTDAATTGPDALRNPIAYDAASIARGQSLYRGNCVDCHDLDGRARNSDVTPGARDLTDLSTWTTDGSDGATFLVIRNGSGDANQMPAFEGFVSDEQIWYIVNYLRSIRGSP